MNTTIENPMTRVKVNNEIDLCEVQSEEIRHKIEIALQGARVSYFLRWQEPGFFARIFARKKTKIIFCINEAQLEDAGIALEKLSLGEQDYSMLNRKSKNVYYYAKK